MKRRVLFILIAVLFALSGCGGVNQEEYDKLQKKYDALKESSERVENAYLELLQANSLKNAMLSTCFGDEAVIAPLDKDATMYQVMIDYYENCASDFGKNLAEFVKLEIADEQYKNDILCIYFTAINKDGAPIFSVCMKRDNPGDKFAVVE